MYIMELICKYCGSTFTTRRKHRIYCSRECKNACPDVRKKIAETSKAREFIRKFPEKAVLIQTLMQETKPKPIVEKAPNIQPKKRVSYSGTVPDSINTIPDRIAPIIGNIDGLQKTFSLHNGCKEECQTGESCTFETYCSRLESSKYLLQGIVERLFKIELKSEM